MEGARGDELLWRVSNLSVPARKAFLGRISVSTVWECILWHIKLDWEGYEHKKTRVHRS